jgi:hypothetical protein
MLDILTVVPLSLIVEPGALFRRVLYEKNISDILYLEATKFEIWWELV